MGALWSFPLLGADLQFAPMCQSTTLFIPIRLQKYGRRASFWQHLCAESLTLKGEVF